MRSILAGLVQFSRISLHSGLGRALSTLLFTLLCGWWGLAIPCQAAPEEKAIQPIASVTEQTSQSATQATVTTQPAIVQLTPAPTSEPESHSVSGPNTDHTSLTVGGAAETTLTSPDADAAALSASPNAVRVSRPAGVSQSVRRSHPKLAAAHAGLPENLLGDPDSSGSESDGSDPGDFPSPTPTPSNPFGPQPVTNPSIPAALGAPGVSLAATTAGADGQGCQEVALSWTTTDIDSARFREYRIYYKPTGGTEWWSMASITDFNQNTYSYSLYPPTGASVTYLFRIEVICYDEEGIDEVAATGDSPGLPLLDQFPPKMAAPLLQYNHKGRGCASVIIKWDKVNLCDGYRYHVQRSDGTGQPFYDITYLEWSAVEAMTDPQYEDTSIWPDPGTAGHHYIYRIALEDRAGQVMEGDEQDTDLVDDAPNLTTDLTVVESSQTGRGCSWVKLAWTPLTTTQLCDFARYEIYRQESGATSWPTEPLATITDISTGEWTDGNPTYYGGGPQPGLPPAGTEWVYKLVVVDQAGSPCQLDTETVTLTDLVPDAVVMRTPDVLGSGKGCMRVTLHWVPLTELCDFQRYEVQRQVPGGAWEPIPYGTSDSISWDNFTDSEAMPGPTGNPLVYGYRVRVLDQAGLYHDTDIAVEVADPIPATPTGLNAIADGEGLGCTRVTVFWDAPGGGDSMYCSDIDHYELYRSAAGPNGVTETQVNLNIAPTETSYVDDGAIPSREIDPVVTYTYRLVVVDKSEQTNEATHTLVPDLIDHAPQAPTGLGATVQGEGKDCTQVTVHWDALDNGSMSCSDIDHLELYRISAAGQEPINLNLAPYETTAYDYGAVPTPENDPVVAYTYRLVVVDKAGQSSVVNYLLQPDLVDHVPPGVTAPAATPTDGGKTNGGSCARVELTWTTPQSTDPNNSYGLCDVVRLEVWRSKDGGAAEFQENLDIWQTYYSQNVEAATEAQNGTDYVYSILVVDKVGQKTETLFPNVKVTDYKPLPFTVTPDPHQGGLGCAWVTLQWDAPDMYSCSDISHYLLYRTIDGVTEPPVQIDASATTYYDSNIQPLPALPGGLGGHTYTYRLVKFDYAGQTSEETRNVTFFDDVPLAVTLEPDRTPNHSQTFWRWTPSSECDVDTIKLEWSLDPNFAAGTVHDLGTGQVHSGCRPNTTYYYRLTVTDHAGQSASTYNEATTQASASSVTIKLFRNKKVQVPNPDFVYNPTLPEFNEEDRPDWAAEVTNTATAVGGKLWAVLEADVGALERFVAPSSTSDANKIRVTELPDATDPNHIISHSIEEDAQHHLVPGADGLNPDHDISVSSNDLYYNSVRWYHVEDGDWEFVDNWQEEPTNLNESGGNVPYRLAFAWQSTEKPQGHNGDHRLKLLEEMRFGGEEYGDEFPLDLPQPKNANVRNLVFVEVAAGAAGQPGPKVATNGTEDYFFFDPDSTDPAKKNPTITFKIEDEGDPHQYKWEIKIRSTSSEDRLWQTFEQGYVASPGQKTITIGQPATSDTETGFNKMAYRGTYAFDINVQEFLDASSTTEVPIDETFLKSATLTCPPKFTKSDPVTQISTEFLGDELRDKWIGDDLHAYFDYYLTDTQGKAASSIKVDFFDPNWIVKASDGTLPTSVGVHHKDFDLYTYPGGMTSGHYKALLTGSDSHAHGNRDHVNKRMVAVNKYKPTLAIEWMKSSSPIPGIENSVSAEYHGAYVNIVWIKRNLLNDSGTRRVRLDYLETKQTGKNGDADYDLPTIYDRVTDKMFLLAGHPEVNFYSPGATSVDPQDESLLNMKKGTIWAGINACFFNHEDKTLPIASRNYGLIGDIKTDTGIRPVEIRSPYPRWSLGIKPWVKNVEKGFGISEMEQDFDIDADTGELIPLNTYSTKTNMMNNYSYVGGGIGCLVKAGQKKQSGPEVCAGPKLGEPNYDSEYPGEYSELHKMKSRTLVASTPSGQDMFLIVAKVPIFSSTGWTWETARDFVVDELPSVIQRYTKGQRNISIGDAALMDGSTHSEITYYWNDRERLMSVTNWNGGLGTLRDLWVGSLKNTCEEYHWVSGNADPSTGRGNRSVVEAFEHP